MPQEVPLDVAPVVAQCTFCGHTLISPQDPRGRNTFATFRPENFESRLYFQESIQCMGEALPPYFHAYLGETWWACS